MSCNELTKIDFEISEILSLVIYLLHKIQGVSAAPFNSYPFAVFSSFRYKSRYNRLSKMQKVLGIYMLCLLVTGNTAKKYLLLVLAVRG